MATACKGGQVQSKIQMILYGKMGTGKSTMASQFCYLKREDGKPFRVLYLDPESGSIDDYREKMQEDGVNLDNLYIVYTQSLQEVRYYISKVKNDEDMHVLDDDGNETDEIVTDADGKPFRADAIVVDGTTILNLTTKQGLVDFSKKRNRVKADAAKLIGDERTVKIDGAGLEYKDYQTVNFAGQSLVFELAASGVHWIMTAREAAEKETKLDNKGNPVSVPTGRIIPDGFKDIGFNAKTVIRMYRDEDTGMICAHVEKDRTHCHEDNAVLEDPTLLDWQAVIDKNKGKKKFVIRNELNYAAKIECEKYEQDLNGFDDNDVKENPTETPNDIIEKILGAMRNFSTSDKAKAKKALADKGLPLTPSAIKSEKDSTVLKNILKTIQEA